MKRTPRAKARALAESYGAEYTDDLSWHRKGQYDLVEAYTPAGKVWVATGCHTIVMSGKPMEWDEMLAAVAMGVEPCGDSDCEYCRP